MSYIKLLKFRGGRWQVAGVSEDCGVVEHCGMSYFIFYLH